MIGNCCHDFGVYYGLGYMMTLLNLVLSRVRKLIKQQKQLSKNANDLTPRTRPLWHCKWAPWRFFFFPDFFSAALRIFRAENWDDISYAAMLKKHSRPCLAILFYFAAMMEFVMEPFCHHNSLDKRPFTFTICFLKIKAKQCLVSNQEESSICKIVLVLS